MRTDTRNGGSLLRTQGVRFPSGSPNVTNPNYFVNRNWFGFVFYYEAAKAVFDYLFNEKDARRLYAYTEDYNIASQKLCERLGMRREGLFIEFISFVNDENGDPIYENTYQYAILNKEWDKRN